MARTKNSIRWEDLKDQDIISIIRQRKMANTHTIATILKVHDFTALKKLNDMIERGLIKQQKLSLGKRGKIIMWAL